MMLELARLGLFIARMQSLPYDITYNFCVNLFDTQHAGVSRVLW